jgi:hypothetical protein
VSVRRERLQITGAFDVGPTGLQLYYVLSLQPFGPICHVEFNVVAFVERLKTRALNGAVMHKNIVAGITADKTIALFIVKPLYGSLFFHFIP